MDRATLRRLRVRIATFNINGVTRRLGNLLEWLEEVRPDVVCLQELKAAADDFPPAALEGVGCGAVWAGHRSWNGLAIMARGTGPVLTHAELSGDRSDRQRRYSQAAVNGVIVASIYASNGNSQPGPSTTTASPGSSICAVTRPSGAPVVLAGDFNVVPEPRDIYPTRSYDADALVQPASRAAFRRLLALGWTDALWAVHPDQTTFTYWDYRRNRWRRDTGLRLDHLLLSFDLASRLAAAGVDLEIRGRENADDHVPVWVELKP